MNVRGRFIESKLAGPPSALTLVFLHEGLGSLQQWRDFPERLSQLVGLQSFIYSRANYGQSDPQPRPPLTYMHEEAEELAEVIAAFPEVILIGHSDGASIAILYAARHPCRGLILEAPHVFAEHQGVESIRKARKAYEQGELRARLARHHQHVDAAFYGWNDGWLHPDFETHWNIEDALGETPTLVIQGANDEYGTLAQTRKMRNAEVLLLDDCGHAPHRDQPEKTLHAMAAFIERLKA